MLLTLATTTGNSPALMSGCERTEYSFLNLAVITSTAPGFLTYIYLLLS